MGHDRELVQASVRVRATNTHTHRDLDSMGHDREHVQERGRVRGRDRARVRARVRNGRGDIPLASLEALRHKVRVDAPG